MTIESLGIGLACCAACHFGDVLVVFAKKAQSINLDDDLLTTTVYSFTKRRSSRLSPRRFLHQGDHVLLVDDFLANGRAMEGLSSCATRPAPMSKASRSPSRRGSRMADDR